MGNSEIHYGLDWTGKGYDEITRELILYSRDEIRESSSETLKKHEHLKKAIQSAIPAKNLVWHRWLDRALEAWCYEPIASEWGASAMGKSSDYGLLTLFDILANPFDTLAVMVTNPMSAHDKRSFKYAKYYHGLLPKSHQILVERAQNPKGLLVDYEKLGKHGYEFSQRQTGIICISNKAGDSSEDMVRHIGGHEKNMILVVDEPQGCSDAVLMLKTNMSAGDGVNYKERFLGNPRLPVDPLGKHSEPSDGDWKKTEHADKWRTKRQHKGKNGICMVRDGEKSPAMDDPKKFWFLYGPQDYKDSVANNGEDSQEHWTYAKGRMLIGGGSNIAISAMDIENFGGYRDVTWLDSTEDFAGLDPAPLGVDQNILRRVRVGIESPKEVDENAESNPGKMVVKFVQKVKINVAATKPDKTGQIAKAVRQQLEAWNIPLSNLAIDVTGNQSAVADRIEKDAGMVYRVNAGGACSSTRALFLGSPHKRNERYASRATELFHNAVLMLRFGQLVIKDQNGDIDTELLHQITTRQLVEDSARLRGKVMIEEKSIWKDRNGGASPDDLDAALQVLALLDEKGIVQISNGTVSGNRRKRKNRPSRRKSGQRRRLEIVRAY